MARTTVADVKAIRPEADDADAWDAYIAAATVRVDDVAEADPSLPDDRLAEIERWLAAHISTAGVPGTQSEEHDSFSADYYRETSFGETALSLDPTGVLADDDDHEQTGFQSFGR